MSVSYSVFRSWQIFGDVDNVESEGPKKIKIKIKKKESEGPEKL